MYKHPQCALCALDADIDPGMTNVAIGKKFGVSKDSARRHRKHMAVAVDEFFTHVPVGAISQRRTTRKLEDGSYERVTWSPSRAAAIEALAYDDVERALEGFKPPKPQKVKGDAARIVCLADWQLGKALADDTPVLTTRGWVNHGDIRPGDYVYSPDGKPVKVLAVTGSTLQECYAVRFDVGGTVVASADHEWEGYFKEKIPGSDYRGYTRTPVRLTTKQIIEQTKPTYNFHVDNPRPLQIEGATDLPIEPYTLGAWLGDGRANAGWIVGLPEDLRAMPLEPWDERDYTPGRNIRFALVRGLRSRLREMGLLGNKHVPEQYLLADEQSRRALLQGLMDTDGTVTKDGVCSFENTNKALVEAVEFLVLSLGMKTRMRASRPVRSGGRHKECWRVNFSATKADEVFALPRKRARLRDVGARQETDYRYVQEITPAGMVSAQCLTVEGGLYLAGRGLVSTHNCDVNGGTKGTIKRILGGVHKVKAMLEAEPVAHLVLADLGDIIENFQNTRSQAQTNDIDLTTQVRTARRLLIEIVKVLAPLAPRVTFVSVPSNHCQVRAEGSKDLASTTDNDWGLELQEQIRDALEDREGFEHVEFVRPKRLEEAVTVDIGGATVGFTHGHQARGADKMGDWWRGQSHGRRSNLHNADYLLHGHHHNLRISQSGDCRWLIGTPSSDPGSTWFTNTTGETSTAGTLTFLLQGGQWRDMRIV